MALVASAECFVPVAVANLVLLDASGENSRKQPLIILLLDSLLVAVNIFMIRFA